MRSQWLVVILGVGLVLFAAFRYARAAEGAELKPGDAAPAFSLAGSDGTTHTLAAMKGRTVVLAWFPKAFTGG